jgi:uncharacterized membrane protein affecting hemolysin expression
VVLEFLAKEIMAVMAKVLEEVLQMLAGAAAALEVKAAPALVGKGETAATDQQQLLH